MRTVRHYVDLRAAESPQATYLIAPETGSVMTYADLQRASRDLAGYLLAHGVRPGDKVALYLHNGYQTARLLIGIMYAGCTAVPLNLLAQRSQLQYVLEHSDTVLVFTSEELAPRLHEALAAVARNLQMLVIDPDARSLRNGPEFSDADLRPVREEDESLLMYTSGTTGTPKGVLHTHRSVITGGLYTTAAHRLSHDDRVLCSLPLYHINGQIVTAVAPLVHGGSVVMPQRFSVSNFWQLAAEHRCTWINVVPTIISYLLNAPGPADHGLDVARVKFCRSASAPLPPELHRAFEARFGLSVIETFGMTETNAPCFTNPYDASARKMGSPGKAYGNEAKIIDPLTGATQPAGVPGEIMVRGENVMKCYYKDARTTERTLEPDGWLHSGDLGYFDEDGFLFVTGRIKELIIKGGENIAPREIDEALLRHPAVLEAAAVGIPDALYGQDIMACVVLKPGACCAIEELKAFAERELGSFKAPKVLKLVDALPKGPSGKVQRLKLLDT
ncbi:MAG TPA: AMP-binding protein [Burkholderiales bacterium]|nr:AMP-binding protein [Burkholderiales bacterium]